MLNMFEPSTVPTARSGSSIAAPATVATSSGSDVAPASTIDPTHTCPAPVRSDTIATASTIFGPAIAIAPAHTAKIRKSKLLSPAACRSRRTASVGRGPFLFQPTSCTR